MDPITQQNRREFLSRSLPAGVGLCIGCWIALSNAKAEVVEKRSSSGAASQGDGFAAQIRTSSGMTLEQVFQFAYRDYAIPILHAIAKVTGRDTLTEILKRYTDEIWLDAAFRANAFSVVPGDFFDRALVHEILEDTQGVRKMRVTQCLWADTFRSAGAADFGYATACEADHPIAAANGEKLNRPSCLMLGDSCCDFTWTKVDKVAEPSATDNPDDAQR